MGCRQMSTVSTIVDSIDSVNNCRQFATSTSEMSVQNRGNFLIFLLLGHHIPYLPVRTFQIFEHFCLYCYRFWMILYWVWLILCWFWSVLVAIFVPFWNPLALIVSTFSVSFFQWFVAVVVLLLLIFSCCCCWLQTFCFL